MDSLLTNADFIEMVKPIEAEIRALAIETMHNLYQEAWKELDAKTLDLRDQMARELWAELGEGIQKMDKLLDVVFEPDSGDHKQAP